MIVSDCGITGDCPQQCRDTRPPASFVGPWGVGMPWGAEDLTVIQRFALSINAGVDQIGGSDVPAHVVAAVGQGLLTTARVNQAAHRVLTQKSEDVRAIARYPRACAKPLANSVPGAERIGDGLRAAVRTGTADTSIPIP
ncbi:hypothetical protein [Actinoplanes awajinensis]|uniref:Uncharacterized protein n=1 Tax=Actinoplanes awajinensis subsp. mycoplanecinus TaxID=135947 RepID=A0A101JIQ5_9ACTN|nr:hypothetical protein [Actinoplanes awajinensis]KUL27570.1 hypothetical protein ADL15_35335 [Actinoplanes awajinensis subsp. mycoplanecinus]